MFGCAPNGGASHLPDVWQSSFERFHSWRSVALTGRSTIRAPTFSTVTIRNWAAEFPRAARKGAILIWREMSNADEAA